MTAAEQLAEAVRVYLQAYKANPHAYPYRPTALQTALARYQREQGTRVHVPPEPRGPALREPERSPYE